MGAVKDGFIRMSGNLRRSQDCEALAETNMFSFFHVYDQGYSEGVRNCEGTYLLALTYSEFHWISYVQGIIVEPTGRAPHECERVGAFQCDTHQQAEFRGRPEFKDFDPENLERETIILV
jgi:hypothetical protein